MRVLEDSIFLVENHSIPFAVFRCIRERLKTKPAVRVLTPPRRHDHRHQAATQTVSIADVVNTLLKIWTYQ